MAYTMATLRAALLEYDNDEYARELADPTILRHFKAGANAAWADRWACDLGRAEDAYESKHGAVAAGYFADGWCWSACQ